MVYTDVTITPHETTCSLISSSVLLKWTKEKITHKQVTVRKENFTMLEQVDCDVGTMYYATGEFSKPFSVIQFNGDQDIAHVAAEPVVPFDSKHVVKYYGCWTQSNRTTAYSPEFTIHLVFEPILFNVRELLDIQELKLSEDQIAIILQGALLGIQQLHQNRLMHENVKAANLMYVDEKFEFKLSAPLKPELTSSMYKRGPVIGTPHWLAPEIITQSHPQSRASDIWSLGITAIELSEKNPPHHDVHPMRCLFLIPHRAPPTLPEGHGRSAEFVDFISRCLQKEPTSRATADELLQHPFINKEREGGTGHFVKYLQKVKQSKEDDEDEE